MDRQLDLLKRLVEANGVPGNERQVKQLMKQEMEAIGVDISYDNLGSIIGKKVGDPNGPVIMIAGHMDEIGMIVTKITDPGFLKFQTVGGWWSQVMLAQQFDVTTSSGKKYRAVMGSKPPHLLTEAERNATVKIEDMYLDLGVKSKEDVAVLGIQVGDMITPAIPFQVMANEDFLLAKAWDNRIGCAIALEVLRNLQQENHPNIVYGVGTVQEEVGLRGAKTTSNLVKPDISIAVDVGIAQDTPGLSGDAKMGEGPLLLLVDGALVGHVDLRRFIVSIADEFKIPYQFDFLARGGTDAGAMHLAHGGSPAISLCIASRYIHSHTSILSKKDFENAVKLITEVVKRLDRKTVDAITYI